MTESSPEWMRVKGAEIVFLRKKKKKKKERERVDVVNLKMDDNVNVSVSLSSKSPEVELYCTLRMSSCTLITVYFL